MRYAMLFPGQGSQYINMCAELYQGNSETRTIFHRASKVLGYDLWDMISNGNLKNLTRSEFAQPAVAAASYALYQNFCQYCEEDPKLAVGHSLGEISALICAGCLSFEDGIRFARDRGVLMNHALEEKLGFAGIVTDMNQEQLDGIMKGIQETDYAVITGFNSPNQFMVGGRTSAECLLDDKVTNGGGQYIPFRMVPMKANAPYHSELMKEYLHQFRNLLNHVKWETPRFPILSTVDTKVITESSQIAELLIRQLVTPVYWNQAMRKIEELDIRVLIDIGPNKIMKNLVTENRECPRVLAVDEHDDWMKILKSYGKQDKGGTDEPYGKTI